MSKAHARRARSRRPLPCNSTIVRPHGIHNAFAPHREEAEPSQYWDTSVHTAARRYDAVHGGTEDSQTPVAQAGLMGREAEPCGGRSWRGWRCKGQTWSAWLQWEDQYPACCAPWVHACDTWPDRSLFSHAGHVRRGNPAGLCVARLSNARTVLYCTCRHRSRDEAALVTRISSVPAGHPWRGAVRVCFATAGQSAAGKGARSVT